MHRSVSCLLLVTLTIGARATADSDPLEVADIEGATAFTADALACSSFMQRLPGFVAGAGLPVSREEIRAIRLQGASACGPQVQVLTALTYLAEGDLQSAWQWRFAANFRSALANSARPDLWRGEASDNYAVLSNVLNEHLGTFDQAEPIVTLHAFEAMLVWESAYPAPLAPPEAYPVEYANLRTSAERARDDHAAAMGLP